MLPFCVHPVTADAEPVQCRDTKSTGEIAVAPATELPVIEIETDFTCDPLRNLEQIAACLVHREERSYRTWLDL